MFSETAIKELNEIKTKYQTPLGAIMPSLYIAQREYGWLSPEALKDVSEIIGVPAAIAKGVASFYTMYKHELMGRNLIQLCTNVSCMILGAESLLEYLKKKLEIDVGETTADGRFSLLIAECIGACSDAPAMLVNEDLHENLTEIKIKEILAKYS
ncbi:MAG: NADH-quinone oxidoreductase subunit NuoE [Nitrospirota bacterium]